jgi:hypothetical protein
MLFCCGSCGIFECEASTRSEVDNSDDAGASADAERLAKRQAEMLAESSNLDAQDTNFDPAARRRGSCDAPRSDHDSDNLNPPGASDLDPWDPSPELHVLNPSSPQPCPESPVLYAWDAQPESR